MNEGRFDRADFGRAENALQLVEQIARQIEDKELLAKLEHRVRELAELLQYGAAKGRE